MSDAEEFRICVLSSLGEIDAGDWDRLARVIRPDGTLEDNPFVSHAFLSALEDSGSAIAETGWLGQHLVLETGKGETVAALPCYLKNHSQGEYVFDYGWADAFHRAGGDYYPKLQCSVPFTPATGPRLLTGSQEGAAPLKQALLHGLAQLTDMREASSAHITFMPKEEWELASDSGLLLRTDRQFHWHNRDYAGFDDFLDSLASRKRKNIRKERRTALKDNGITIEWLTGGDLTEAVWDDFFHFYMDTGSRKWGRPYLTRSFYSLIGERMADRILLVMAKRDGRYIAGAINFIEDDCLFGRHWGAVEDIPCLHFEVCYYQAIEFAIENKLARVEAGAQGEHKLARGYVPETTYSAHYVANPSFRSAIADYLETERRHVEMEKEILADHAPFRRA